MNKMYVKPNTKVLAVKAEQLMAAVSSPLNNDNGAKLQLLDEQFDDGMANGEVTTTSSSKRSNWDTFEEDAE